MCALASRFSVAASLVALAALSQRSAQADAFLEKAGAGKVIATGILESGAGVAPVSYYRKFGLTMHAEYGASDSTTLVARTESGSPWLGERDARGTGAIGVRRLLFDAGAMRVAAQALASVDAGLDRLPRGGRDTALALEARLAAVATFAVGPAPAFFMVSAGPRAAAGEAVGARFDVTLGMRPFSSLLLLAQLFGRLDDDPAFRRRDTTLRAQASAISDLTPEWSVQAGVFAGLTTRASLRERGLLAAVIRRF